MKKGFFKTLFSAFAVLSLVFSLASCNIGEISKRHTVCFIVDGKEYARTYSDGTAVELPDEPEKEGYEFDGWYFDVGEWESELDASNLGAKESRVHINVYAKFVEKTAEGPSSPEGPNDNPSGGNDNPSGGNDNPSGGNDVGSDMDGHGWRPLK